MDTIYSHLYKVTDWRVSRLAFPPAYLFQSAQTENRMRKILNTKYYFTKIVKAEALYKSWQSKRRCHFKQLQNYFLTYSSSSSSMTNLINTDGNVLKNQEKILIYKYSITKICIYIYENWCNFFTFIPNVFFVEL